MTQQQQVCERCGKRGPVQIVETTRGEKQQVRLCADCIEIVVRPNTNYQVKSNPAPGVGTTIDKLYYNPDANQPNHSDSSESAWWDPDLP